jgi:CRP-like cAMP-binding protein
VKIVLLAGLNLTAAPGKRWTQRHHDCNHVTLGILNGGDFFGEDALAGQPLCMWAATTTTDCERLRIHKKAIIEALHRAPSAAARIESPSVATESILQRVWSSSDTKRIKIDHRTSHWVGFREMSRFGRLGSYNGSE